MISSFINNLPVSEDTFFTVIASGIISIIVCLITMLLKNKKKKPNLRFELQFNPDYIEPEVGWTHSKHNEADYCIYCYNDSTEPFVLVSFELVNGKRTICIYQSDLHEQTINPVSHKMCKLTIQDLNSIKYHCKEYSIKKCNVFVYHVNRKKHLKYDLDLFLPSIWVNSENMSEYN